MVLHSYNSIIEILKNENKNQQKYLIKNIKVNYTNKYIIKNIK